jgi:long-subunit acyl-CoA synthetase (AMP-forming)
MGTYCLTQQTLNYRQYFDECFRFGKSLIATGHYLSAVNIIGFNAPQWNITFFGSIFARCLPVGIYTTNSESSCAYIAEHSECKVVVAENMDLAKKYISLLSQKKINYIVLYNETKPIADNHGGRLLSWNDFLNLGKE